MTRAEEIAEGLSSLEREWITGWQGPGGAAFNCIAEGLCEMGLLNGGLDWRLNATGLEVRKALMEKDG